MLANLNDQLNNCQQLHRMLQRVSVSVLPYTVKGTSEPIKRILSNHDIKVAQKPHQTIGNLFLKPKDPVVKDQTRGAISVLDPMQRL